MSVTVDRTPIQQFKADVAIVLARVETRKNKLYSILDALSEYEKAQKLENVIVPRKQLACFLRITCKLPDDQIERLFTNWHDYPDVSEASKETKP